MNHNRVDSAVQLQAMPEPTATSGRALALAQTFADRVDVVAAGLQVEIQAFFGYQLAAWPLTVRRAMAMITRPRPDR